MAFNYEASNLLLEIEEAELHRDKHTKVIDELHSGYKGAYFREDQLPDNPTPENHAFEYVSLTLPKLIYDNPQVNISSRNPNVDTATAKSIEYALNQWIKDEDLHTELEMAIFDALFGYGILLTTLDDAEDYDDTDPDELRKMLPKCRHLERHLYFRDPTATVTRKPRFEGHVWVRDKEDVLKMEGIDADAVNSLDSDGELAKLKRPNGEDSPQRHEIVAYEVYVAECNDYSGGDPECHGTIFTLAVGQAVDNDGRGQGKKGKVKGRKAAYIREPRPYFGPKTGPYTMIGFYPVSNECYPLSPLAVTAEQAEEVNVHATAVAEAAGRMKNMVLVDSTHDELALAVKNSVDGSLIGIAGLAGKSIENVEIKGPAQQQLEMLTLLRDRLDRVSGMSDAYRGNTNPNVTAHADEIAYAGITARMNYLKSRCRKGVSSALNIAGWLLFHTHNVLIPLGHEAAQTFGMNKPVYMGGVQEGQEGQRYEDLCLEIEPMSMEPVDEHTLKSSVLEVMAVIVQMAQEMPQMPWLRWQVILDQLSRLNNFGWLREVINNQMFQGFMQQTMQATQSAQQTELGLKKAELLIKAQQAHRDNINQGMQYKDVPDDIRRQMEARSGYVPSVMPLSAPDHMKNLAANHSQQQQQLHEQQMQQLDQAHQGRMQQIDQRHQVQQTATTQQHERKQSVLSGLLKAQSDKTKAKKPARKAG